MDYGALNSDLLYNLIVQTIVIFIHKISVNHSFQLVLFVTAVNTIFLSRKEAMA